MAQPAPNLCLQENLSETPIVYLNAVCGAIQDLPWRNIWSVDNPVEALKKHLSLLVGHYASTKFINFHNKDKPLFDDQCRCAFDLKQEAHLRCAIRLTANSLSTVMRDQMKPTRRPSVSLVSKPACSYAQSSHKWWPNLKSAVVSSNFVIAGNDI